MYEIRQHIRIGWYLNHTQSDGWEEEEASSQRIDGTLFTWYTSSKNCCTTEQSYTKCLYKPRTLQCAITYNVTIMQKKNKIAINDDVTNDVDERNIDGSYPITVIFPRDFVERTYTFEKNQLIIEVPLRAASEEKCRRICEEYSQHQPKYTSCKLQYYRCVAVYDHVAGEKSTKDFHYVLYGNK